MSRLATLATALTLSLPVGWDYCNGIYEPDHWRPRHKRRDLPNEYTKSRATKRRRARNRMAARSRRRNRI